MMVLIFFCGLASGLVVGLEIVDRLIVRRLWRLVEYWRAEHVKAKWEAIAAKEQIIKERNDDIRAADYWKHTED